jgi:hypothetical protein
MPSVCLNSVETYASFTEAKDFKMEMGAPSHDFPF